MDIAIIGSEATQGGWAATAVEGTRVTWIQTPEEAPAGALLIDSIFDGTELRISQLLAHKGPVWVNDVAGKLPAGSGFVRVNGWNGFERSARIEAAAAEILRADAEAGAAALGKTIEWLPDTAGFVTPRVIAMIVNEAFHALSEGVSSRDEIDTAMKLGTNYPHGPFVWAGIIGLNNITELLEALAKTNERYTPNELLLQEARM
jgi:3-hydroxybutyryl-CoA dehydrogenase